MYIHPIVVAINNQVEGVPRYVVGCYDIRSGNNTAVRVRPQLRYNHHQILLSFDEDDYNMQSINEWRDEFMNWIRTVSGFAYVPTFIFGGYINNINEPHYLAQYMLDGDVRDFVRLLYDNADMTELMLDDEVRIGCFGPNATNEVVSSRIL